MERKEAIEVIKRLNSSNSMLREALETLIPELKESGNERIKQALIELVGMVDKNPIGQIFGYGDIKYSDMIAWLEKQDNTDIEQVFRPLAGCDIDTAARQAVEQQNQGKNVVLAFNGYYISVKNNTIEGIINEYYTWCKKQGKQETLCDKCKKEQPSHSCQDITELGRCAVEHEQKLADKIKAKFHEGDWITFTRKDGTREVLQVSDIIDSRYYFNNLLHFSWSIKECDEKCHLWSINDAKEGDVLVCPKYAGDTIPNIFIFKDIKIKDNNVFCYCSFLETFRTGSYIASADPINTDFYPATKEQRDLLFTKMKEAGYEWNEEKKELRKIEQNPAWSVEDEKYINDLTNYFVEYDDLKHKVSDVVNWLKSLRPQNTWKPSDEQMKALNEAEGIVGTLTPRGQQLNLLYKDLNKLKED